MSLTDEVMKKREFKMLPKSIVEGVLSQIDEEDSKEKVKQARIIL
jgi:hypothetical protein